MIFNSDVTEDRLRDVLHYSEATGVFTWKKYLGGSVSVGDKAGFIRNLRGKYYRQIRIDKVNYFHHRLAWLYTHGEFPKHQIDHIDGNSLNNRIENLRDK